MRTLRKRVKKAQEKLKEKSFRKLKSFQLIKEEREEQWNKDMEFTNLGKELRSAEDKIEVLEKQLQSEKGRRIKLLAQLEVFKKGETVPALQFEKVKEDLAKKVRDLDV